MDLIWNLHLQVFSSPSLYCFLLNEAVLFKCDSVYMKQLMLYLDTELSGSPLFLYSTISYGPKTQSISTFYQGATPLAPKDV